MPIGWGREEDESVQNNNIFLQDLIGD